MRNSTRLGLMVLVLIAASAAPAYAARVDGYAFAQITTTDFTGDGAIPHLSADRMRIGFNAAAGAAFGGVQLDFNADNSRRAPAGTLQNWVKDVFVGYKLPGAALKAGQFKTPVGMDFNVSGKRLDITKRGLEKPLVLERDLGLMASGRDIGYGFGYDVGVFNPAGRSGAVFGGDDDPFHQTGEDIAYAVRGHYDPVPALHFELSYGESQDAGGTDASRDYQVVDAGVAAQLDALTLKAEYIDGDHVLGAANRDEQVYYLHAGYRVCPTLEAIVRHYQGASRANGVSTDLANTYFGVNLFFGSNDTNGRVQINYVLAGADERDWNGLGGFRSDAVLVQLQFDFAGRLLGG